MNGYVASWEFDRAGVSDCDEGNLGFCIFILGSKIFGMCLGIAAKHFFDVTWILVA